MATDTHATASQGTTDRVDPQSELQRGFDCADRDHYADAALHFSLARDNLTNPQVVAALDAYIESHTRYWQAQQALHEVSRRFVAADDEQHARLAVLRNLPAVAIRETPQAHETAQTVATRPPPAEPDATARQERDILPGLHITCFGGFAVWRRGERVELCQNRNGQAILRYLATQPRHRETMDALMEAMWPEDPPDVALHKLHVAASALRRALNSGFDCRKGTGYLLYDNGIYQLNPDIPIWIDVEEFMASYRAGQQAGRDGWSVHYEAACKLYTGPFMPEDLYQDWSFLRREQLTQAYLSMCEALAAHYLDQAAYDDAAAWAAAILDENRCHEAAYRQLMRAYAAQGRRSDALRQYGVCERVLAAELGVEPMPETTAMFYAILNGESLPPLQADPDA